VYVDYYEDGYYMYNRGHPGVRIAMNVFLAGRRSSAEKLRVDASTEVFLNVA
jgi:hypothetical protein